MRILKRILCIAIPVIIIFLSVFGVLWAGVFNKYAFTIDATKATNTLHNVVNNVNVWSIEGNPFVGAEVNKENNIFEFVDYVQRQLGRHPFDQ